MADGRREEPEEDLGLLDGPLLLVSRPDGPGRRGGPGGDRPATGSRSEQAVGRGPGLRRPGRAPDGVDPPGGGAGLPPTGAEGRARVPGARGRVTPSGPGAP